MIFFLSKEDKCKSMSFFSFFFTTDFQEWRSGYKVSDTEL